MKALANAQGLKDTVKLGKVTAGGYHIVDGTCNLAEVTKHMQDEIDVMEQGGTVICDHVLEDEGARDAGLEIAQGVAEALCTIQ